MKKIPDKIAKEIIELKKTNHSYKDISDMMKKRGFPLERHTVAKICQKVTASDGASVSNKPSQIPEISYHGLKAKALSEFKVHAEAIKSMLNEEALKQDAIEIMLENEIISLEDYEEIFEELEKACDKIKRLEEENNALKVGQFDRLLSQRVAILEKFIKQLGYDPNYTRKNNKMLIFKRINN